MGRLLSSLRKTVGFPLCGAAAGTMLWVACSGSDSADTGSTTGGAGGAAGSTTGSTTSTGTTGAGGTIGSGTGGSTGGAGGTSNVSANVLQFHKNLSRDGLYIDAAFTKANAARIHMDTTFRAAIQGATFAQPLYFEGAAGGKNIVVTATMMNQVSAFDAASGAVVWQKTIGTSAAGSQFGCGDMATIGITGTPVIDAATKTLFFDAAESGPTRRIHALSLDDGTERAGWPVDVVSSVRTAQASFLPRFQSQRAAPTLVNGTLYVPYGGIIGDCDTYHGWVAGIPINAPTQVMTFATAAVRSGIWGPGGVASDGTNIFVATGNAPNGAAFGQQESVLRLQAGPVFSGMPADFFTPSTWRSLDTTDADLGGSGPVLVDVPGATPSKLVVQLGKDHNAYLIDRDNLGGMSTNRPMIGEGVASAAVSTDQIIQAAAAYRTALSTYVVFKGRGAGCPAGQSGDLTAIKISATNPPRPTVAWCAQQGGNGSPMVTTTDGQSEAIVWSLGSRLMAFDGDTGAVIFNGGVAGDALTAMSKFVTPIAARGRIFVATNSAVHAFTMQ